MSVYDELCGFVLGHRSCGEIQAQVGPTTEGRYSVLLRCSCGTALRRSVTQEDAHQDLLRSAPLVVENRTARAPRRRRTRYGVAPSLPSADRLRLPSPTRPLGPPSSEVEIKLNNR